MLAFGGCPAGPLADEFVDDEVRGSGPIASGIEWGSDVAGDAFVPLADGGSVVLLVAAVPAVQVVRQFVVAVDVVNSEGA